MYWYGWMLWISDALFWAAFVLSSWDAGQERQISPLTILHIPYTRKFLFCCLIGTHFSWALRLNEKYVGGAPISRDVGRWWIGYWYGEDGWKSVYGLQFTTAAGWNISPNGNCFVVFLFLFAQDCLCLGGWVYKSQKPVWKSLILFYFFNFWTFFELLPSY